MSAPIRISAQRRLRAAPAAAWALATDPARFPSVFPGFGPVRPILRVTLDAPLAVGSIRRVHSADGSVLRERITVLDPPQAHAYVLDGFAAPFSWLVREGTSHWRFSPLPEGCEVVWTYDFALTSVLLRPLVAPLLRWAMGGAMRRCLARFDDVLGAG